MHATPGKKLLQSAVVVAGLALLATTAHANTSTAFPTGSLIIPVGSAFQDDCGAVSAYGLMYNVLRANTWLSANGYTAITVFYPYLDTQGSPNRCTPTTLDTPPTPSASPMWTDGCDITNVGVALITNNNRSVADAPVVTYTTTSKANVYPQYPSRSITGTAKANYLGGPFVILASDAPTFRKLLDNTLTATDVNGNTIDFAPFRTRNATQTVAPASGCAIGVDHYVNIHKTTSAFIANIGKAFQTVPPRLALLATDKNSHTVTVSNNILQGYLLNAGLNYVGSQGCPPASVQAANAAVCPNGAVSGQIYDSFDFDDLVNGQLQATSGGAPLYQMLWTPHWEVTHPKRYQCAGTNCKCNTNCTAACAKLVGTGSACTQTSTNPGPPTTLEQNALNGISAFLDGQTGLAAECASVTSYEGDWTGGAADTQGVPQFQTCLNNGAGVCAATQTPYGIDRNGTGSYLATNIKNCSDPNQVNGSKCIVYPYPGDSFAQTGDYSWSAVAGHTQAWLPNTTAVNSIYRPGVVPLISEVASLDTTKIATPTPYNGSPSTAETTARPIIVADLTTRSVKDNVPGKANILYLAGHDERSSVSGTKVMLETLLQLGISTLPPIVSITEVSRNSPIAVTVGNQTAIVQGTFEFITSSATTITTPTFSSDADAATFRFPFTKGHLRARATSNITTTSSNYNAGTAVFDASGGVPDATFTGCATYFNSDCRTVFTTIDEGVKPALHFLNQSEATTLGPLMASNLTPANQALLVSRVLAGDDSLIANFFRPALGGVDRSTVAVIEASTIVNGSRPTMAYFGGDDGMMHAICMNVVGTCDVIGRELWAYIPRTQLPILRYNNGRIDGSPHVIDAFGDFTASGQRGWHTILMFQTGSGDTTANARKPGVYALDVSDPANPIVLWEYSMTDTAVRGTFELGTGLTLSAGAVQNGTATKWMVYAQTNNGGTSGSGDVVTAINIETGKAEWQDGYAFAPSLRSGGASIPSGTGIPGGVVAIDTRLQGYLTDVVWGTLYGDVWRADPATGISKDGAGKPLFRFSTDNHPIGAKPAIFVKGAAQYAVISTGGYVDTYPSDTTWSPAGTSQYVMAISLATPIIDATINEGTGLPDVLFKFAYGSNEKGIAQATVIGNQVFVTTDTADTNDNTNPGAYGTGGATGHVYRINLNTGATAPTLGTTVIVEGGVSSVINSGTGVYSGAADQQSRLATDATAATYATGVVDSASTTAVKRRLWIRTQ
ncbi:hypothetical protein BH11MYX1_BH11MYX1_07230 [soil metagenome]